MYSLMARVGGEAGGLQGPCLAYTVPVVRGRHGDLALENYNYLIITHVSYL